MTLSRQETFAAFTDFIYPLYLIFIFIDRSSLFIYGIELLMYLFASLVLSACQNDSALPDPAKLTTCYRTANDS